MFLLMYLKERVFMQKTILTGRITVAGLSMQMEIILSDRPEITSGNVSGMPAFRGIAGTGERTPQAISRAQSRCF